MEILPDGRVIAVGVGDAENFTLMRLTPEGLLDTTFGTNGSTQIDFTLMEDESLALAVLPDGRILVGGAADRDTAVARFSADGVLDRNFGIQGRVFVDAVDEIRKIVPLADGRFLAGNGKRVVRFLADGELDPSFGTDSQFSTFEIRSPFGDGHTDMGVLSDGRIVLSGVRGDGIALAKLTPEGVLDLSFGTDGVALPDLLDDEIITFGLTILPDDRLVVVDGYEVDSSEHDFLVAVFHPDGTPDSTFSEDGVALIDYLGEDDVAFKAAARRKTGCIRACGGWKQRRVRCDSVEPQRHTRHQFCGGRSCICPIGRISVFGG